MNRDVGELEWGDENDEMKVLYDADGKPVLDRVYGTDEIDRLDRERDDEWERDKYTGFWKEDAGYGHPIWIDGAVSISQLERDLKKELVEMGYDHETAERRANQVYQDKVREGYRRWDTNQGKYIEIRGTQSHEEYIMQLQNDLGIDRAEAERRIKYEERTGYSTVTVLDDGTVVETTVVGTDALDYLAKTKYEELSAEWKLRVLNGYNKPVLDEAGEQIIEDDPDSPDFGKPKTERIEGTYYTEAKLKQMALDHDVDMQYVKAVIDRATEGSLLIQDGYITSRARQFLEDGVVDTMKEARALAKGELDDLGWKDGVGVTLSERLSALDLAAAEKRWEARKDLAYDTSILSAVAAIGRTAGPSVMELFFGDGDEGDGGWTSLIFDLLGGI